MARALKAAATTLGAPLLRFLQGRVPRMLAQTVQAAGCPSRSFVRKGGQHRPRFQDAARNAHVVGER